MLLSLFFLLCLLLVALLVAVLVAVLVGCWSLLLLVLGFPVVVLLALSPHLDAMVAGALLGVPVAGLLSRTLGHAEVQEQQ